MHPPKCAQNMEQRLAALRRDQEIDGLRVYLIKYNLFPRNRDPQNSPIRIEELKELVKHWKLHRQRGFWRDHPEKDDLVRALLQHIRTEASSKKRRQDAQDKFRKVNGDLDIDQQQANAMTTSASSPSLLSPSGQINEMRMGDKTSTGDLFYTRGHYDEGLIYLSRMEKSKQVHKMQHEHNDDLRVVAEKELDLLAHMKDKEATANLSKDMKLKCSEGLYNVSCYPNNESQMLAEGAVPIVSGLLKNLASDDVHVRLYCAATLLNLSMTPASRALMVDQGAIPLVLELAHANNITCKLCCAHTLFRFSGDEDIHFHLVHDGCVMALLQLMAVAHDELKELCMKALINLSVIPRSTSSDTVLSTLISLAKVDNAAINLVCAKGLLNLSIMPTTRVNVVEDGAILALKILCSYQQIQVSELASAVLCNLAAVRANQECMVKNGALAVLVELFELPQRRLGKPHQAATPEGSSSDTGSGAPFDLHALYTLKAKWIQNECASLPALTPDQSVMLDIHMQCATTLSYFSCNTKLQPRLVSAGFVPRVLGLLAMRHDDTTKTVTLILSNLASHESCRVHMVADGCVRPIISLMSSNNVDMVVKQDCVIALCNLMLHPQTYKEMVDDGVVPALVAYSENPHPDIQKSCAFALLSLTMDTGMKAKLVGQGVIVALINLADRCASRVDLRAACVCALFQLSTDPDNATALFYDGTQTVAITVLNEPISPTQPAVSHRMWMHALALLSNMATYDKGRSVLVDDGAVDAVLRFLQAHTNVRTKACARYVARAQSFAASMLCKLRDVASMHSGYFASLLALASTHTLSSSSSSRSDVGAVVTTLRCALAFAHMSGSMKGRRLMANHPDVAPGLNSMMRTGHHETQLYAAIGLCNLAMERGATPDRIWADNTVSDFIVVALLRVNSDETKLKCAKVLFNLLTHDDTREKLIVDGVLYALIKLAKLEIDTIRELCLQSIYNISLELGKVQRLVDMEIVRILSTMFQTDHSKEMKRLVCGILSNISAVAGNERQLVHEGALAIIASLVKARDPETRVYCASALSNFSCNPDVAEFMLKDEGNIVAILISLSRAESKDIRRYATGAISNLSASRLGVDVMTREGMIGAMRELLNRITCDVTLALCVRALRNLMVDPDNQAKLVACHGVQILSNLIEAASVPADESLAPDGNEGKSSPQHANPAVAAALAQHRKDTGIICAELLCLLCTNAGVELQLVEDGIVRALTAISKQNPASASAKLDIISCFSSLSKNPLGHDQMLKDGIMEAIVSLCMDNDDQSMMLRASLIPRLGEAFVYHMILTMRNLTSAKDTMQPSHAEGAPPVHSHDVNRARVSSQANAIAILLACATSSQPDTREHVAVTLFNLSCHRRSRGLIISNEGVKVLIRLGQNAGGQNAAMMKHVCALALQSMSTHQDANIMQPGLILAMTASMTDLNVASITAQMSESIAKKTAAVVAPVQFLKNRTLTTFLAGANFAIHHRGTPADWTQVPAKLPPDDGIQALFQADEHAEAAEQDVDNKQVLAASAPRACNLDATCGTLTFLQDDVLTKNKMLLGPHGQDLLHGRPKSSLNSVDMLHPVSPLPSTNHEKDIPKESNSIIKSDPEVIVQGRSSAAQVRKEATKTLKPATPPSPVRSPSKKQLQARLEPIQ
ncbi:hypothetical protein H310_03275 [Aphanomyces invadans]|uniref:Uncharacterized protein n=1 Tax=Aphanomyces invadans TaxID=157072 RepID=A0A024UGV9_9STRA|nr:hypothetical protein H310_03275 [Aphanomyces invadans]ETW05519.1 hypothetical protein H310_03275 [Aphanomyces invadans]|eukprot:XP_008865296.1 hypothetical protein H310_03275 [Aphanomyces invadans]